MKRLILTFLVFIATIASAGTIDELPVDEHRGPWFQTIDLDAQDYAYDVVTDPKRKGPTALRFELRDGECYTAYPENPTQGWDDCTLDRERSEVRERWNPPLDKSVWYAISVYIPADYEPMYPKQIFLQWHAGPSPAIYYQLNKNNFYVDILGEVGKTTTQFNLGKDVLTLGEWHDIEVNIVWSGDAQSGRMILYVDGKKLVDYSGVTLPPDVYKDMQNGAKTPEVKFGIYRSHLFRWTENRPHPTHIIYFDEYRRGLFHEDVDLDNFNGD